MARAGPSGLGGKYEGSLAAARLRNFLISLFLLLNFLDDFCVLEATSCSFRNLTRLSLWVKPL